MKNLVIRTDKLGDFYIGLPYINSIKKKYGKNSIDIILSENLFEHFSNKNYLYGKIYSFPNKGILKRIKFLINIRRTVYENIFILDGKDKSILIILLLKGLNKFIVVEKRKINIIFKILTFKKKYKIIINNKIDSYKTLFGKLFSLIDIKLKKDDYKFLKQSSVDYINFPKYLEIKNNNYNLFHFDEKWFSELYLEDYTNININEENFKNFITNLIKLKKTNLIITTGIIKIQFIQNLKNTIFKKCAENIYEYSYEDFKAVLCLNSSINDLEVLSVNAKNIITCNGPVTHLGNAFSVNVVDIIEKKLEHWYNRHISNTENYNKLYRKNFNDLSVEILSKIK